MSLLFRPALDVLGREMFVIKYQRCPIGAIMQRGWAQDWYVLLNRRIVAVAPTFDAAKVIAQHEFTLESEWQLEAGQ